MSGLYTRPAFEQRVRGVVADKKPAAHWSALYIDVGPAARHQRQLRHARRRQRPRPARRADAPPAAAAALSRARISGDRFAVLLPTQLDDAAQVRRIAARRRRAARHQLHGDSRLHVSISIGVAPLDTRRRASSCIRSPPPRPPARPPRTAAAIASRSTSRNDVSLVRRFADINIAGQLRAAIDAGPAAARCAAHPAVRRRRDIRARIMSCCCA